jgi:hypothetical protein
LITVEPGYRYGAFLGGVTNWFGEQRAFYVGETSNLRKRLRRHAASVNRLIEAAEKEAGAAAPDITLDSFGFGALRMAGAAPQKPRNARSRWEEDDRLAVEAALVVALRPVANGLGFGSHGKDSEEIWELLSPSGGAAAHAVGGEAPWMTWPIFEKLGGRDPRADEDTDGVAYPVDDRELDELAEQETEPGPAVVPPEPHKLGRGGERLGDGRRPQHPPAE